jgi:hypothetical protein
LVTLELAWALDDDEVISLGYDKDFLDSYFTNYVAYHYGFVRYESILGAKLSALAEAGYRLEAFHGEVTRTDQVLRVSGELEFALGQWLGITAGSRWDRRVSVDGISSVEYDDVNIYAGLVANY